ncbi:MAG: hypothetical protein R3C11_14690 [Planctomycetaceae bacterium]
MSKEPEMPLDWDDHAGWESFYVAVFGDEDELNYRVTDTGSFSFNRLNPLFDELHCLGYNRIWFPGCGFSPLPRIFVEAGFDVVATDIAEAALSLQRSNRDFIESRLEEDDLDFPRSDKGDLTLLLHDFRTPLDIEPVDAIFNIKAIQALPPISMRDALKCHYEVLRPGGNAVFDTMNVQGDRRDLLEDTIVSVGFYLPLYQLQKNYRAKLAATGIPYAIVLGQPRIMTGQGYPYSYKSPEYDRDHNILAELYREFISQADEEFEREQQFVDETAKRASIIYSTG